MSDPVRDLFAAHGLRCTPHRRAIYETLSASHSHPTADELYQQLNGGMSLATVYNTLESFCDAGIVRKFAAAETGCARYDAATDPHVHAIDETTGQIADVPDDLGEQLLNSLSRSQLDAIEKNLGFRIDHVRLKLLGRFESPSK